ncbi:MAG: hypothetical protein ACI4QM_05490 [Alphaproteobacteria bacterium]
MKKYLFIALVLVCLTGLFVAADVTAQTTLNVGGIPVSVDNSQSLTPVPVAGQAANTATQAASTANSSASSDTSAVLSMDAVYRAAGISGSGGSNSRFARMLANSIGDGSGYCWFCPILGSLFDALNKLVTYMVAQMASIFLGLMGVGLLFSIAFKVGKMVTQLQAVDVMQFMTDMFKHLGRAIIASALLLYTFSIFTFLLNPLLSLSMSVTQDILSQVGTGGTITSASQDGGVSTQGLCADLNVGGKLQTDLSSADRNSAFGDGLKSGMQCMLRNVSASLVFGLTLGRTFWDIGWSIYSNGEFKLPDFYLVILGATIMIGYFLILLAFPFKLIDALIRLAFVCALAPLWIILWVFPPTVGYTKKAWDMFLSTCLIFICLGVVLALIMMLLQSAIPNREALIGVLMADKIVEAQKMIPISGSAFLVTLGACCIGYKMLGMATTLASSFIGAIPNLGIGNAMQSMSVKATMAATPYAKAAGRKAKAMGDKALDKMGVSPEKRTWMKQGGVGVALWGVGGALPALGYIGFLGARAAVKRFWGGDNKPVENGGPKPSGDNKPVENGGPKPIDDNKPVENSGPKPSGDNKPDENGGPKPSDDNKPDENGGPKPSGDNKPDPIREFTPPPPPPLPEPISGPSPQDIVKAPTPVPPLPPVDNEARRKAERAERASDEADRKADEAAQAAQQANAHKPENPKDKSGGK